MKKLQKVGSIIRGMALGLAVLTCVSTVEATPYASHTIVTNISGTNFVQFIMNESGATVSYVTLPSGASNTFAGTLPIGKTNFVLPATDTSFQIYCTKLGNGTPAQITTDANTNGFNLYPQGRGMDINKNPKIATHFGRMYIGNSTPGVQNLGAGTTAKGRGLYALNADCTEALGKGTNASYTATFTSASASSPFNISINPNDDTVDIADFSTANASVFKVDADFQNASVMVLGPLGENQGFAAGTHGDPTSTFSTGSIAGGNLTVWTMDPDLGAPASGTALGLGNEGPTTPGQFNMMYRYDIGAGPLPWAHAPNSGVNLGLPGFQDSQTGSVTLGPDLGSNYVYAQFFRANLSDPDLQVFTNNAGTYNLIYSSFTNGGAGDAFGSSYAQCRVSPDGLYIATISSANIIRIANLTNGVPDNSTIITIANTSSVSPPRGLAFDAADNIYEVSSGQGLMRGYSLGNSAITVTGNDTTGTNGTFQLILPSTVATVTATTPLASQNYINSSPAGTPIPGVFTVSLSTNVNILPVVVQFALSGTATLNNQYTLNTGTNSGIIITGNTVTFPAGTSPSGNWSANLVLTPTATPVIGPGTTATITLSGGGAYRAGTPKIASLSIANTGPQYVFLTAAASGTTMNRGIPNDYAKFTLTRWGDTNGPNNLASSITPLSYTVQNITYLGTATFPGDYGAQAQRIDPTTTGVNFSAPATGSPGIVVKPGDVTLTCIVGDPVFHSNPNLIPTNVTIIVNLTNSVTGTNGTSVEGYPYFTSTVAETLTEIDNAKGPETVVWSNALTNALDNTWTAVYANTNLAANTVLPIVVPNYTNTESALYGGGSNDFRADFGNPVANDSVPPSPLMTANGWTTALRVTANKDGGSSPAAINLYPQGVTFSGNMALRFSMYLSTYQFARGNPSIGTPGREFALFGIDHAGTNANWRPTSAVAAGTGSGTTNCDGIWVGIDSGTGSLTPADFDAFSSAPLPNAGTTDIQSAANTADTGIFKNPPFVNDMSLSAGSPANLWVDVSLEKIQTTNSKVFNINTFVDRGSVIAQFNSTNQPSNGQLVGNYTNGTVMLGYEDPVGDVSDNTAFVYYSNVRVVELSPFINGTTLGVIATNGQAITLTNSATYVTVAGITNVWSIGATAPVTPLQTNVYAATNMVDSFTTNVSTGTNFFSVTSDSAGSTTSAAVIVEDVTLINRTANLGANFNFPVTFVGQAAPTVFQWQTNGINITNNTKYTNATTATLTISNVQTADTTLVYGVVASNAFGAVTPTATLSLLSGDVPAVSPAIQTNVWGSSASFTVTAVGTAPFTYAWKKGATVITNNTHYSGATNITLVISNITAADATNYTAFETNSNGALPASTTGTLVVTTPPPTISPAVAVGANVVLQFSSTNAFDTTNAFQLESSKFVGGPYTTNTNVVFSISGGGFQVVTPVTTNSAEFYRLKHVP